MPSPRALLPILAALLAATPGALAADGRLVLESSESWRVQGALALEAPGGTLLLDLDAPGVHRVTGYTGRVTVWTQDSQRTAVGNATWRQALAPEQEQTFHVVNATLELRLLPGEAFRAVLAADPDVRLRLEGDFDGAGVPSYADEPDGWVVDEGAEDPARKRWEPSWTVAGSVGGAPRFPAPTDPALRIEGPFASSWRGGNVTLLQEGSPPSTWRLGRWAEGAPQADAPVAGVARERMRVLMLEGAAEALDLPMGDGWTLGAPEIRYHVDGRLAWTRASGTWDGEPFRDALVAGDGRVEVVAAPARLGVGATGYEAAGEWERLSIGGRAVARDAPEAAAAPAAALGALALLLALLTDAGRALLGRAAAALYTRIESDDVLGNPMRRRILEEVRRAPGLHLRELHRRVGGGWGAFDFHLGILRRAGHVRIAREGRYAAVYPMGQEASGPVVHHPVTRRVLDLLPPDGSCVPLPTLRERADLSRQLLDYHLARLEQMGLARREGTLGASRVKDVPAQEA